MKRSSKLSAIVVLATGLLALASSGCRESMPHSLNSGWWCGDIEPSHGKPPDGVYKNWDPYAATLELSSVEDTNPVRSQHVLVATVNDKDGKPLPNRRVEWIVADGGVGNIIEVDESGFLASRGYKVTEKFAVSHTSGSKQVLDRGTDDPSDDITIQPGQTWCVIMSPVEGDTHLIAYAPGIYDWNKQKVFATSHWSDVKWQFPPPATNAIGTAHEFVTSIMRHSDGAPLADYEVTYRIVDGPAGTFDPGGGTTTTVKTDANGVAKVTLKQVKPVEGTNNVSIDVWRIECGECKPKTHLAAGQTTKTWIGPRIACNKTGPASAAAGQTFEYHITVNNPSPVEAKDVTVTDTLPDGIEFVSSNPPTKAAGQAISWSLGSIGGGAEKSVTVSVKANKTGKFENCADVKAAGGLTSHCCVTTVVTSPKLTIEKRCPASVTMCDQIDYVIVVRNSGDGPANKVSVSDTLPEGVTTVDGKKSVASDLGDLAPGQSKEVRIAAKASKTGKYENKVIAKADGGLSAEAVCTVVVTKPELVVTKTGPEMRYVGRPAVYEITVTNKGDTAARETVLTDTVPAGTEFTQASEGGKFAGGVVTWSLGTLDPGASKKVSVTLKPLTVGTVKNVATAKAICAEATAEATMAVKGVAAILLEMSDDPDPIEIGATTTYTIVVTNQGSINDANVVITAMIPAEEEYVSSDGVTKATVDGKTVKFAPLATLAPKARVVWKIVVKGTKEADVRFKISLKSDATGDVPVEQNESTHIYH